jgi:hypothetical protein
MKKTILKEKKTSQFNKGLLIYAISSIETDLRLCMKINQWLNISLSLDEDIHIPSGKVSHSFRRYSFEYDEGIEKYFFILNRSDGKYLFPELKKVDYLLIIYSEGDTNLLESRIKDMKSEKEFTVLYPLSPDSLRSLDRIMI